VRAQCERERRRAAQAAEVKRLVSSRQAIQPEGPRSRSIVQHPRNIELLALFLKMQNRDLL
jgi:SMC interacting uncharacterized protein involved in chromosome segregation